MGVGKTTVCKLLCKKLQKCVFLDGDWCWDMHPFVVNEETKKMVVDNICHTLNNFLKCRTFDNIVFCWVLHEQHIVDEILSRLDVNDVSIINVSLTVSEKELRKRLIKDIENGSRDMDIIERSIARLPLYDKLNTTKICTDNLTAEQVAQAIANLKVGR